jgi:hypothetical protein
VHPINLQVDDIVVTEARWMSLGDFQEGLHDDPDVPCVNPWRAEHNPRVATPLVDGIATEPSKVPRVGADQTPPLARREGKLLGIP